MNVLIVQKIQSNLKFKANCFLNVFSNGFVLFVINCNY